MDLFDRLLGHDQWTTARLLELSGGLTDAQLDQPFDIGHRTLRKTFDHMFSAVELWTRPMVEEPVAHKSASPSQSALIERHERTYANFENVARRMCDEQRLDDTFVDHYSYRQTFGATIIQVILHNERHRSEALHILNRLGVPDLPDGDPREWEHMTNRI